jgi:tetratricopeptide (TPR) repeat protein
LPEARSRSAADFRDVCFVIMPFGTKKVGTGIRSRKVDFDKVYDTIFVPAISAVTLPASEGGGKLRPVRTDREFFSGHISQAMFEYIEYARYAVADITAVNANVFYELGARHRAHESGTAIFRQDPAPIPFDINQIKAFPYTIQPQGAEKSKELVRKVLTESLVENAWDSPIMLALRAQRNVGGSLQDVLRDAENALRDGNFERAHELWLEAATLDPDNPRHDLKASAWPKTKGDWDSVIGLLQSALAKEARIGKKRAEPSYGDAYRELGIAQNKRDRKIFASAGEESLRSAVHYSPTDFDSWASLGGVLRRADRFDDALEAYDKAVEVSDGHPYPLLMALKLRARKTGTWQLTAEQGVMLGRAEGFRRAQVENDPPIDVPWSYFDLAEIQLYLGRTDIALATAETGFKLSTHDWMPGTFLSALELLENVDGLPGVDALAARARARADELKARAGGQ